MAGKNKPQFALTDAHRSTISAIDAATKAGNVHYISRADGGDLAANGYITVNPENQDEHGNAAATLTDLGNKELPAVTENTETQTATASPAVTFKIASVAPPAIVRKAPTNANGGGRAAKYPLASLEVGQAIFIPAEKGADFKKLSKSFGSMVATFNRNANQAAAAGTGEDKYLTSRGLADGKEAGFGDEFEGVPGTGLYREALEKRPVRKPRKAKATAETAPATGETTGTTENQTA